MNNFHLTQFTQLHAACIDASSLIYCSRAGFFDLLQQALKLYTLPEIVAETGYSHLNLTLLFSPHHEHSNDQKLLFCAIQQRLPLISEDKQLLKQAEQHGLCYYKYADDVKLLAVSTTDRSRRVSHVSGQAPPHRSV